MQMISAILPISVFGYTHWYYVYLLAIYAQQTFSSLNILTLLVSTNIGWYFTKILVIGNTCYTDFGGYLHFEND